MAADQKKTVKWELPSEPEPVKNVVLVGRTGNGKSATANSIIGKDTFESDCRAVGVTTVCQTFRVPTSPIINVIDTPGLFDLAVKPEYISQEIISCLAIAQEGLHAVVLVLSVAGRISQEEESTLRTLQILFGGEIIDYLIVLFTGGDILEAQKTTLEKYLSKGCPEFLKEALRLCGGRKVVFDNKTKDESTKAKQIQELLDHIAHVEKQTCGKPFTDKMHRQIQKEAERVRKEAKEIEEKNIAEEEKAELKRQLEMSYGQNMNMMAQMMERMLKESAAANERQMNMMKDFMEITILENEAKNKRNKEKMERQRAGQQGGCSIL